MSYPPVQEQRQGEMEPRCPPQRLHLWTRTIRPTASHTTQVIRCTVTHPIRVWSAFVCRTKGPSPWLSGGVRLQVGFLWRRFLVALLAPFAASAGTAIACDDFANLDAAQHLLDLEFICR